MDDCPCKKKKTGLLKYMGEYKANSSLLIIPLTQLCNLVLKRAELLNYEAKNETCFIIDQTGDGTHYHRLADYYHSTTAA